MGVPTLFIRIIKNKFYKNVHQGVKNGEFDNDYFFMDYNQIIYNAYERVRKEIDGKNLSKDQLEALLIDEVVRYTIYLVVDVIKPKVLTYIAMDGPAPRAKMVTQRSRRYMSYQQKMLYQAEKKKHNIPVDKDEWDRSANIAPGTVFMEKLSNKLLEAMKKKLFNKHNPNMQLILSDGNVPGEGEHKFLPIIRSMRSNSQEMNRKIVIYGRDADLIVLAVSSHKNNISIMRDVHMETDKELRNWYMDYEFLVINIDNLETGFFDQLTRDLKNKKLDKVRVLNDYIFITDLMGNDFIDSMPFMKIRQDGLEATIAIYHQIKDHYDDYLIDYHPDKPDEPYINQPFFEELMMKIGEKQDKYMKGHEKTKKRLINGFRDGKRVEAESHLDPFKIYTSRFEHLQICSPEHPLFHTYLDDFTQIDYDKPESEWRLAYYKQYLGIDAEAHPEEFFNGLRDMVENYCESLIFTLRYYYQTCPSWHWFYRYRVPPLPSDVYEMLNGGHVILDKITFKKGKPYTPFEQLMMIYPPQMDFLLPAQLRPVMTDPNLLCIPYYPTDFRIDASAGVKYIYSEALLPEIDEEVLLPIIQKIENELPEEDKKRNQIREKPIMVAPKKGT